MAARPLPAPNAPYELIVAGDALNYLGDLAGVFAGVADALSPEGLFLFTLEAEIERRGDAGFRLHEGCRYRHEEPVVRTWLQAAGFETLEVARPVLRREKRRDVAGLLFVSRRLTDAVQAGAPVRKPPRTRPEA
jgi:predicted TPR repeat methyltransferase